MPIDLKYDTVADSEAAGQVELVRNPLSSSNEGFAQQAENGIEPTSLVDQGRTATIASSYINLVSTCVGAGIIGMPYAFSKAGWILGSILLLLGASFSFIGANLLAECTRRVKSPATFYSVAEAAIPKYAFVVDIMVAIKCTGVTTSYLFIIGDSLPLVMEDMNAPAFFQDRIVCILLCCLFVCIPISLFPKLDHLRFSSWLSGFMLLYLVLLVALYSMHIPDKILDPCILYKDQNPLGSMQVPMNSDGYLCPIDSNHALPPPHRHSSDLASSDLFSSCKGPQSLFLATFDTLSVLSIFAFNYSCQQNVFTIVDEIHNPTMSRLNTVFALTFGTALIMYITITYTAYSTFGSNMKSDVLSMYPETKLTSACRVMLSLILSMHYPLQLNPARKSVLSLIKYFGRYGEQEELSAVVTQRTFYGVTLCIFAMNLTFAFFFKDLGVTYQICGATGSTLVIFVLPGLFYYILHSGVNTAGGEARDRSDSRGETGDETRENNDRDDRVRVTIDDEEEEGGDSGYEDSVSVIHFNKGASQHGLMSAMDHSSSDRISSERDKERKIIGPVWKLYLALLVLVVGMILMPLSTVMIFLQIQIQQH